METKICKVCGIVPYVVLSGSMEPTIETGSVCFINKIQRLVVLKKKILLLLSLKMEV